MDDRIIAALGALAALNIIFIILNLRARLRKGKEEWHRALVGSFPDAVIVHDKGQLAYMNPAAAEMFGMSAPVGKEKINLYDFIEDGYHASLAKNMQSLAHGISRSSSMELRFVEKNGQCRDVEMDSAVISLGGKEMVRSVLRDITKRKAAGQKAEYLSTHDPLTGLYNHFHLHKQLSKFSGRREFNGGVMMLDINELRKANETYGHSVGDELIKAAAKLISGESREEDVVACVGGDKFCILLPNTDREKISAVAARLRTKIQVARVRNIGMEIAVGTAWAGSGKDLDAAIKVAEENMRADKHKGQTTI